MAPEKAPAFWFYPRDFVGDLDVAASSLEEVGFYTLLLCYAWLKDGLPNDHAKLAKALRLTPKRYALLWSTVGEKFPEAPDGRLRNERQEEERRKQQEHRSERSAAGRSGNAKRWGDHRLAIANASQARPPEDSLSDETAVAKRRSASAIASADVQDLSEVAVATRSDHQDFVDRYFERFTAVVGSPPKFDGRKDGAIVKRLLASRGADELRTVMEAMFASTDDFVRRSGYSLGFLSSQYNKLLVAVHARPRALGPVYDTTEWTCAHEPPCGTRVQHNERLRIEEMKRTA